MNSGRSKQATSRDLLPTSVDRKRGQNPLGNQIEGAQAGEKRTIVSTDGNIREDAGKVNKVVARFRSNEAKFKN
jgi:hypothetical protein